MGQREEAASAPSDDRVITHARPTELSLGNAFTALEGPRLAWTPPDGPAFVAGGSVLTAAASGPDRFETVRRETDRLAVSPTTTPRDTPPPEPVGPRFVGGFAFADRGASSARWRGFDSAWFFLPRIQVIATGDRRWLVTTAPEDTAVEPAMDRFEARASGSSTRIGPPPGIVRTERRPDRAGWAEQVTAATDRIRSGSLEKVVLAQRLTASLHAPVRVRDALDRLDRRYPGCYRFAVDPGIAGVFFGATPERLVRLDGGDLRTEALAGSIGRGGTPAEDARLAEELRASGKVRSEHRVVVETIRDQLAGVADRISVGDRTVRKLANVQHLSTPIAADTPDSTHVLSVVEALHPTPAVGGRPPGRAEAYIRNAERFDRGWYAAPVGWFDAAGDGCFAVGIRSAIAADERATLFAGNGIVADSDPDDEWDELQLKYRPILDTLRTDAPQR